MKFVDKKEKERLAKNYNASSIKTMKGLSAVRERPGMYLGSPQSIDGKMSHAQLQMAQEILSNSIDEAQNGFGDKIIMTIHQDNSMTIQDFGRGIPKGKDFEAVIRQLTVLHTSGKVDADESYVDSGGQNGVGLKGTNALSSYVDVEVVTTQQEHYHMRVQQENILEKKDLPYDDSMPTGSIVTFHPDDTYFETIDWDDDALLKRIEQSAYLTPNIEFIFVDERRDYVENAEEDANSELETDDAEEHDHYYRRFISKNGLGDYVHHLAENSELITGMNEPIPFHGEYVDKKHNSAVLKVDGALLYTTEVMPEIHAFANSIPTMADGPHVQGAKQGIFRVFKDYAQNQGLLKGKGTIRSADTQNGLLLALSVKIPQDLLFFDDQAKTKLSTQQAKPAVDHVIEDTLSMWLADHPDVAIAITNAIIDAKQVREDSKKMRKAKQEARKKANQGTGKLFVSSKLKPASAKDPKQRELYIVEGDSACLAGDTKIKLSDNRVLTIEQIVDEHKQGKVNYVYSNDLSKHVAGHRVLHSEVCIKPIAWAGITRKNAQLVRLHLDDKTHIDCTPDHLIMLVNGSYKRADQLTSHDTLAMMNADFDHHVVWVERLKNCQDVYDLTVDDTHNFCLSNGLFVHNCGGLLKGRNPKTQGLFPIRGKILNVEGKKLSRVMKNEEISTITAVLGAGIKGLDDGFNPEKLEYDKIIIASDADADGYAIRALLITLFYNYFPGLIETGHLYYVNAPLFKVTHYEHGNQINTFAYNAKERDQQVNSVPAKYHSEVSRFKGLGEMSTEESKTTLLDKSQRYLTRVTVTNAHEAKSAIDLMMGNDSAGRKEYMETKVDYDEEDVG